MHQRRSGAEKKGLFPLFTELFTIDGLDDDFGSYHSSSEEEDDVPHGEISCVFCLFDAFCSLVLVVVDKSM